MTKDNYRHYNHLMNLKRSLKRFFQMKKKILIVALTDTHFVGKNYTMGKII